MNKKLNVAILGATGAVGQRFIQLLENHPWFKVAEVVASERSAGRRYGDAVHWVVDGLPPQDVANLIVKPLGGHLDSPLVFSALPKEAAVEIEPELASAGHVVATNASAYRMETDVPLMLAEVNSSHLGLIDIQRKARNWTSGALAANSNCTIMPVVMALAPLLKFGVTRLHMVSQQATSGAGYPGVASLDILDNVIPYVSGDEDKMPIEARKMLGQFNGQAIVDLNVRASTTCTRVPVIDSHLVHISVELESKPSMTEIIDSWSSFRGLDPVPRLPSSPALPVQHISLQDRPQPRRDRMAGNGMASVVGRLRPCEILGYKFFTLAHNTIRGAAGSSIQNAELMAVCGYIDGFSPEI
ncbi:MAG: aspartate-semialdehyde dehydrogenase [Chloroflexi bacterium]|nr:aspartate-semialdehyde dehydrogenase [Chloroflexota bacterium]